MVGSEVYLDAHLTPLSVGTWGHSRCPLIQRVHQIPRTFKFTPPKKKDKQWTTRLNDFLKPSAGAPKSGTASINTNSPFPCHLIPLQKSEAQTASANLGCSTIISTSGAARTRDRLLRRQLLYPTELRKRAAKARIFGHLLRVPSGASSSCP